MKSLGCCVVLCGVFPALAWGQIRFVRAIFRSDPSTSVCIAWESKRGRSAQLLLSPDSLSLAASPAGIGQRITPFLPERLEEYKGMRTHFVRLQDLKPATTYYLRIRDNLGASRIFSVQTLPNDGKTPLSLVAGGDSRSDTLARQRSNLMVRKLRPHAVLFGGDMTVTGTGPEWEQWFRDWELTIDAGGRLIPIVASRGNHEFSNAMLHRLFDVPNPEVYYALNLNANLMRFYTLNTETAVAGSQTAWFVSDLTQNGRKATWRVVQYHKPMRPHVARKEEGDAQYEHWAQALYDERVQLVVECDAHVVKTTWPIRPSTADGHHEGFVRDDEHGTVYVGEGTWAVLREADDLKPWTRGAGSFHQFKWLWVYPERIELRTVLTENAEQVGQVTENNRFKEPANLKLWALPDGERVVKLRPQGGLAR